MCKKETKKPIKKYGSYFCSEKCVKDYEKILEEAKKKVSASGSKIVINTKEINKNVKELLMSKGDTCVDEYKSKIEFKPGHIIVLAVVILVVILLLHAFGYKLLGI